ncbi:C2H2 finger domain protein [Aspergillus ellipticus CBS 707.79]|uniref:C2H2 finger domain protein n=1 Tax=Aspergillus ellipticus CBS 707.79 TaxID=1448320 RepID=A0A319CYH8_9EURO|nr:C2H2 finger domain protein [Aspergillus ellipticus CBS 707.79]
MRRSTTQAEIPLPITYTPTTHRISKAKKGKRVHACEYPGCNKVFTRAEHRRRHELNHNPEALYRCTQNSCKKAFHRPDLLARHMERHELEAQMDRTAQWQQQNRTPIIAEHYVSNTAPVTSHPGQYLAVTQPQNAMSVGSLVAPAIHPELSADCGLMWNSVEIPSGHQTPLYHGHPHIHESVEDSRFYATPETCPSPLSDGTSLSVHSHSRSSVVSTPVTVVEPYPESMMEPDLTSSPMSMQSNMRCWEQPDTSLPSLSMMPLPLSESLLQPTIHCPYPSPGWSTTHSLTYDDHTLPPAAFPPAMQWKPWAM